MKRDAGVAETFAKMVREFCFAEMPLLTAVAWYPLRSYLQDSTGTCV